MWRLLLTGIGTQTSERNAGIELAQWMPRSAYMKEVNNGNAMPKRLLKTELAARALAAYIV